MQQVAKVISVLLSYQAQALSTDPLAHLTRSMIPISLSRFQVEVIASNWKNNKMLVKALLTEIVFPYIKLPSGNL